MRQRTKRRKQVWLPKNRHIFQRRHPRLRRNLTEKRVFLTTGKLLGPRKLPNPTPLSYRARTHRTLPRRDQSDSTETLNFVVFSRQTVQKNRRSREHCRLNSVQTLLASARSAMLTAAERLNTRTSHGPFPSSTRTVTDLI